MPFVAVILLFLFVILFDFVPMLRKKSADKKTVWLYSACLVLSFAVLAMAAFNIDVPSPTDLISYILEDAIGLNFN